MRSFYYISCEKVELREGKRSGKIFTPIRHVISNLAFKLFNLIPAKTRHVTALNVLDVIFHIFHGV